MTNFVPPRDHVVDLAAGDTTVGSTPWNTIYMDAALDQLRSEGFDVRDEDVARLSPLVHKHINMLGRYVFTLPEPVARGELRPLRSPATLVDDDA